jgi:GNAT superfamily N-acetyltransferase
LVLVRAATAADWQALRDIRLDSLREAPDAFAVSYAEDAAVTEAQWRDRAGGQWTMFLAFVPGLSVAHPGQEQPAGMAGCFPAEAGSVHLVAMFVRPAARGRGVGEALIEAVLGWARDHGAASLDLWVTEANKPARRLYERCGFTPTGARQPLPSNPALTEIAMSRVL